MLASSDHQPITVTIPHCLAYRKKEKKVDKKRKSKKDMEPMINYTDAPRPTLLPQI